MYIKREYLSEREVAQLTGRALSTLRNERHLGKGFPYIKVGRTVRYNLSDVLSFMKKRKIKTEN